MARSQPGQLVIGPTRASATRRKQNRISWIAATGARNGDGRGHLASDREFWHQADEADDVGAVEKLSERHDCKRLLCGVTVLRDASQGFAVSQFVAIQTVGPSLGVEVIPVNMRDAGEIEQSVANFARSPNGGLIPIPSAAAVGLTAVTSYPPTTPSFFGQAAKCEVVHTLPMAVAIRTGTGARRGTWHRNQTQLSSCLPSG